MFVVNRYCKLEKKKKKKKKIREKMKYVKHVIKSDEVIYFCLTFIFCTNEPASVSGEKTCLSHLYKLSIEWHQTCSSSY